MGPISHRPADSRPPRRAVQMSREAGIAALLATAVGLVACANPAFLAGENVRDLLVAMAPVAIVACGLTLVVLAGEIDISVGSALGLLGTVLGLACSPSHGDWPVWAAVLVTLLLGAAIGLLNGLLVTVGRVPSIIVTLGMLSVLRGANDILLDGRWITDLPPALRALGTGSVLGIRISTCAALAVAVTMWLVTRETPWGRRLYAVGSNPEAARMAGLPVRRVKLAAFAITGSLVGLAAVVSVPQLSVIESGIGVGFELLVVTCVVVGGTSIAGGRGTILGTLLAVALLGIVRTALIFLKLGEGAAYWERAIQGAFIQAAVLADHLSHRATPGGERLE